VHRGAGARTQRNANGPSKKDLPRDPASADSLLDDLEQCQVGKQAQ